jgi:hypothetical protein
MTNVTTADERATEHRNFMNVQADTQIPPVFRAKVQNLVPL